jgi:FlaA1/EpsC-like NDP-sugar epimerase
VNDKVLEGKRILVPGGTGSLGKVLVRRVLSGEIGVPSSITVYSRDEAKQHQMRLDYLNQGSATDEIIFENFKKKLKFQIGDVKDFASLSSALRQADIVFNAAALKQVPTCEYFPFEAVQTNIIGAENIVNAIQQLNLQVETVVGISTDKACLPINVMGMTKALQERIFIQANMRAPGTRFICVRYGNVLASRGSVIPLFHEQINSGGPVTITDAKMTRFWITLDQAVDCVFAAVRSAKPGETFVPLAVAANMTDVAAVLIGDRDIQIEDIGIRPGEKLHEALVSEEESHRTVRRGDWYAIQPMLPELLSEDDSGGSDLDGEFSSADNVMSLEETEAMLQRNNLMLSQAGGLTSGLIR